MHFTKRQPYISKFSHDKQLYIVRLTVYSPLSWMTQGLLLSDSSTRGELLFREPDRKKTTNKSYALYLIKASPNLKSNSPTFKTYMHFMFLVTFLFLCTDLTVTHLP